MTTHYIDNSRRVVRIAHVQVPDPRTGRPRTYTNVMCQRSDGTKSTSRYEGRMAPGEAQQHVQALDKAAQGRKG